jgi:SpoVK/Ycf46/Vps4 family AAA+-type ATPase
MSITTAVPQGFAPDLIKNIRSLSRFIYVVTEEEDVFLKKFKNLVKKFTGETFVFSSSFGLIPLPQLLADWESRDYKENPNDNLRNLNGVLIDIYKKDPQDKQNFYIILDPEIHLSDPMIQRRFLDMIHQLHSDEHNVKIFIFLSNVKYIPRKLSRYIRIVEDKGLAPEEIAKTLNRPCTALETPIPENHAEMFRGMTTFEIEAAVSQSIVLTMDNPATPQGEISPAHIHAYRREMLKRTGLLEYVDTAAFTRDEVGGIERFKTWAGKMRSVWTDEGRSYGLKIPKGVLLVGIWGTGKSLSAKMLGTEWGLPVVLLEMGKLRSSGVGDTEGNIYAVLKMVESIAPCILWIDEAEKSLSGGQSSAQSDSGTTARSLGIFSTWIAETSLPITLVMTANRLSTLPVEFVNRMDESWFFDLPSVDERIDILKIHLASNKQDSDNYNLLRLAEAAKDMVGREIKQAIEAALIESFHAQAPCLNEDILERILRRKPRIVKTMVDEVTEIKEWVGWSEEADDGIKAHFASTPNRKDGKFIGGAFEIISGGVADGKK